MSTPTPLLDLYRHRDVPLLAWGPDALQVVRAASFAEPALEYASIRKSAALVDESTLAVLDVEGSDRLDFLNRMITQECASMQAGDTRRSFWLNRKGRIDADLHLIELGDRTRVLLDVHTLEAASTLASFIFTEDVTLTPRDDLHVLGLHGPGAPEILRSMSGGGDLSPQITIEGVSCTIVPHAPTLETGYSIIAPSSSIEALWGALESRARPCGWFAFNVARVEAGTPLLFVDFATDSLPHETGIVETRVSFRKGCYLGQEIVARMQSLGRPKQSLVALRASGDGEQPSTGAPVRDASGEVVGNVTSSVISPMLGDVAIAFAMMRTSCEETDLVVDHLPMTRQPSLRFLPD
ncbi:MAG: aminomethyltransferase family protein [Phycisphaerales bacterium]|nr:aminomethyltransferase family protein [Phycisphaerales bacterium]